MEFFRGKLVECFESPERAHRILAELEKRQLLEIVDISPPPDSANAVDPALQFLDPVPFDGDLAAIYKAHDREYVDFVRTIFDDWRKELKRDKQSYALPHAFNRLRDELGDLPKPAMASPYAKLGYYSFDACT